MLTGSVKRTGKYVLIRSLAMVLFTRCQQDDANPASPDELTGVKEDYYVRVRGTSNLDEPEPEVDPLGENPWNDVWFYTNPSLFL